MASLTILTGHTILFSMKQDDEDIFPRAFVLIYIMQRLDIEYGNSKSSFNVCE